MVDLRKLPCSFLFLSYENGGNNRGEITLVKAASQCLSWREALGSAPERRASGEVVVTEEAAAALEASETGGTHPAKFDHKRFHGVPECVY